MKRSDPKTLVFCASARTGLGHLRRITNIARQIRKRAPDVELALVLNAQPAALDGDELALFARVCLAERADMARAAAALDPDAVVVDTAVLPDLDLLPARLALVLRETAHDRARAFRLPAGRQWDTAVLAEPADHWTIAADVIGARRVENVGWIYRTAAGSGGELLPRDAGEQVILVATGGGGSQQGASAVRAEIDEILCRVLQAVSSKLKIVQVLGPRADDEARLCTAHEVVDVGACLNEVFAAADLVISTAGYNSVLELASTTTPAVLVSVPRTYDDQQARAELWGEQLGLAHRGDADETATWILRSLSVARRRPPAIASPSGDVLAARTLIRLIAASPESELSSDFTKTSHPSVARRTLAASHALFAAGVATPPARAWGADGTLRYARLEGPTAQDVWCCAGASMQADDDRHDLLRRVAQAAARIHAVPLDRVSCLALDPFARIAPRLAAGAAGLDPLSRERAMRAFVIARGGFLETAASCDEVAVLVHGDFHLRQLIACSGRDDLVVVDLDDLAIGPAEFDIANLAAHIATKPELSSADVDTTARTVMAQVARAYEEHSDRSLSAELMRLFLATALLRRLLKLAAAGDIRRSSEILDVIEASLGLSSPEGLATHPGLQAAAE